MSSLDDFFAKKDRKKKGSRPGDGSKNDRNHSNNREKIFDTTKHFKFIDDPNGDEWLDFEENRDKDYSGLKIQSFSIKQENNKHGDHNQSSADYSDESKDQQVWSKKEVKSVEQVPKEPEPTEKYIPPSLRSSLSNVPKKVSKNIAPEIENKSEFPSLA